jgi:AbrB family looped-hinge helix DNA binding protein
MEVTVSAKYQIVIPLAARKRLNIQPGQKICISNVTDNSLKVSKPLTPAAYVKKYTGVLANADTPWQKEHMDAAAWIRKQRNADR